MIKMGNSTKILAYIIANRGWKNGRLVEFAQNILKTGKFNFFKYVDKSVRKKIIKGGSMNKIYKYL